LNNKNTIKHIEKIQKSLIPQGWKIFNARQYGKSGIIAQRFSLWIGYEMWKEWLKGHKDEYMTIDEVTEKILESMRKAYEEQENE
jgi:hypothetical protein